MDLTKWQSLNRRLEALLAQSFESADSIHLALQLVSELESEYTYMKTMNGQRHSEEIFSTHLERANLEHRS